MLPHRMASFRMRKNNFNLLLSQIVGKLNKPIFWNQTMFQILQKRVREKSFKPGNLVRLWKKTPIHLVHRSTWRE